MTCCEIKQNIEPKKGDSTKTDAIEAKQLNHVFYNKGKEKVKTANKNDKVIRKEFIKIPFNCLTILISGFCKHEKVIPKV